MRVLVVGGPRPLAAPFPLTLALSHEGRGDARRTTPAPPWEGKDLGGERTPTTWSLSGSGCAGRVFLGSTP